jgi:hypothetical protein
MKNKPVTVSPRREITGDLEIDSNLCKFLLTL